MTGKPLNFDIIDAKEIRKVSVKEGYAETFSAKNSLMTLRFENGQREENQFRPGEFWLLHGQL